MRGLLLVVALVAVGLVATNPSRAEFNEWAKTWVVKKIEKEARRQGEDPNDGSSQIGGAIAGFFISAMPIERQNLLAFSIYRVRLPQDHGEEKVCSVLGIGGQFVALGEC
jgi:hypothetical protein